ncbi:MAG: hypothetical protein BWK72_20385 [Rhodoferax ferrireducens]|uniref:Uncharacterized protein n=1 Tax=Rhodoferax ferrireducens TaxID=192843 RepID=A0A1W9KPP0_9BURK|nr:MAG: hypothetical protein BWK72_20385 [Rhodoferax ferrireducens]
MDPHQKTILADDFGVGFTCHYLVDQHGFEDFGDTNYVIKHMLKGKALLKKPPKKRGAAKSPDFIAVDGLGRLHVLECKGTQSSRTYLKKAMEKGRDQKLNISSTRGTFKTSMVGGLYVPLHKARADAELVFLDPEPNEELIELGKLGRRTIANAVRRVSLSKMLSSVGLWQAATTVFDGTTEFIDPRFVRDIKNFGLRFAGFELNSAADRYEREVEYRSFEPRGRDRSQLDGYMTRLKLSVPENITDLFSKDVISEKGVLPRSVVDQWIGEALSKRRRKYEVTYQKKIVYENDRAAANQPLYKEAHRKIKGSWTESSEAEMNLGKTDYSSVTTGQGFSLEIERRRFE